MDYDFSKWGVDTDVPEVAQPPGVSQAGFDTKWGISTTGTADAESSQPQQAAPPLGARRAHESARSTERT